MSLPRPNFVLSAIFAGLLAAAPVAVAEAAQPPDDDPGPGEIEGDDDDVEGSVTTQLGKIERARTRDEIHRSRQNKRQRDGEQDGQCGAIFHKNNHVTF